MDFETLKTAREILGLGERASLKEIKAAFRRASKKYHPDSWRDEETIQSEEMIRKINEAYHIILSYCDGYRYSFSREQVEKTNPENILEEQFKDDWLCS